MELNGRRYERTGVLAVDPMAFTMLFAESPDRDTVDIDGVPVLTIRGPLEHHAGMWCDSYDAILARASEALSGPAPGIVLRVDSPGGFASGCMETARAIRALADGSGKRLIAYVDGQACSAAYALACAAHSIVTPQSGTLGSIGVLMARTDASEALASVGVRLHLIKSGARKGDGTPEIPVSADELAAFQDVCDTQAALFFAHVAAYRPLDVDAVAALQAGLRIGAGAVSAGLADYVGDMNLALALARGQAPEVAEEPQKDTAMTTMSEAVEALRAAAEGDDEEESARAKRMLKAMDEEEEAEAEGTEEEPEAEDDAPPKKDEDDEPSAKAIASKALATAERAERMQLLATRPDITPKLRASLENAPCATIRAVLDATPRVSVKPPAEVKATRGEGQGAESGTSRLPASEKSALDARMGLASTERKVVYTGNKLILGATVPTTKGA